MANITIPRQDEQKKEDEKIEEELLEIGDQRTENDSNTTVREIKAQQDSCVNEEIEPEQKAVVGKIVSSPPFDPERAIQLKKKVHNQFDELRREIEITEQRTVAQLIEQPKNSTIEKAYLDFIHAVKSEANEINERLDRQDKKLDNLQKKKGRKHELQPLRAPISGEIFEKLILKAGKYSAAYQRDIRRAQLKITYTILYYLGLRLNELQYVTLNGIREAIQISQFQIIVYKTNKAHRVFVSKEGTKKLKALKKELDFLQCDLEYKYLFGKDKPLHRKTILRIVNNDLRIICENEKIPHNIKSHSFRIGLIARLLEVASVDKVAQMIGHEDIRSTIKYQRPDIWEEEAQELRALREAKDFLLQIELQELNEIEKAQATAKLDAIDES